MCKASCWCCRDWVLTPHPNTYVVLIRALLVPRTKEAWNSINSALGFLYLDDLVKLELERSNVERIRSSDAHRVKLVVAHFDNTDIIVVPWRNRTGSGKLSGSRNVKQRYVSVWCNLSRNCCCSCRRRHSLPFVIDVRTGRRSIHLKVRLEEYNLNVHISRNQACHHDSPVESDETYFLTGEVLRSIALTEQYLPRSENSEIHTGRSISGRQGESRLGIVLLESFLILFDNLCDPISKASPVRSSDCFSRYTSRGRWELGTSSSSKSDWSACAISFKTCHICRVSSCNSCSCLWIVSR